MSDYPKDKLGNDIAPGVVVAFATRRGSGKDLNIARVERVEAEQKMRWTPEGQVPYTSWGVLVKSRRHNWRDDTYSWGGSVWANWTDMVVLHETVEDVEDKYSIRHNQ